MSYSIAEVAALLGLSKTIVSQHVAAAPEKFRAKKVPTGRKGIATLNWVVEASEAELRERFKYCKPKPRRAPSVKLANKDLWTIEEAATHAGINKSTAYGRAKAWNFTSVRYDGKALYPRRFVERLVAERPQPKEPKVVHLRTPIGAASVDSVGFLHTKVDRLTASLELLHEKMDRLLGQLL